MATIGLRKYYTVKADYWTDVNNAIQNFMGWTLHDDIDANTKVYKSNGENADKPYIYVRLSWSGSSITIQLWLYWNATTHVGTTKTYQDSTFLPTVPGYNAISGNKDIIVFSRAATHAQVVGFLNKKFYTIVTTTTADIATGDNVNVAVDSSANFMKGGKYQIVGVNNEGRDLLTVITIPDGTHITFNNIPRNYASGAYIGATPCPAFLSYDEDIYLLCPWNGVGNANSPDETYTSETFIYTGDVNPDKSIGYYVLAPWKARRADAIIGYCDAVLLWAHLASFDDDVYAVNAAGTPEQGTASSATSTTLSDTTKVWSIDQWAGKHLVLVDGTGRGQARKVSTNTATQLTVVTAWDTIPDATSTYRIVDTVYRAFYSSRYFVVFEDRAAL